MVHESLGRHAESEHEQYDDQHEVKQFDELKDKALVLSNMWMLGNGRAEGIRSTHHLFYHVKLWSKISQERVGV